MTEPMNKLNGHEFQRLLAGDLSLLARVNDPADIAALKLAIAAEPLADALARDVARVQRGSFAEQFASWWQGAGMPTALAAGAITAIAIGAFGVNPPSSVPAAPIASQGVTDNLFVAAFEAPDNLFGGAFEQNDSDDDRVFGGDFDG